MNKEKITSFLKESAVTAMDTILEPIRFSQALYARLETQTHNSPFFDYDSLSRFNRYGMRTRNVLWGYMAIVMPVASGVSALGVSPAYGAATLGLSWVVEGVGLRYMNLRGQESK